MRVSVEISPVYLVSSAYRIYSLEDLMMMLWAFFIMFVEGVISGIFANKRSLSVDNLLRKLLHVFLKDFQVSSLEVMMFDCRICQMQWTLQKSQINLDYIRCVSATGTFRQRVPQVEMDFMRVLTGLPTNLKIRSKLAQLHHIISVIWRLLSLSPSNC